MIAEFAVVWQQRGLLLDGFMTTALISALAALASLGLGAALSTALMSHRTWVAGAATALVDAMRCMPFLLFAYLVYYGLPSLGLRLGSWTSGLTALVIYHTAYMAELLRGAWRGLPVETIEAGRAYGFHGFELFRRVILPPVAFNALPTLGNQVIQVIKDSAFLTIITVTELTHAATSIQATHFVPFAAFVAAVLLYWIMCLAVEGLVGVAGARAQAWRRPARQPANLARPRPAQFSRSAASARTTPARPCWTKSTWTWAGARRFACSARPGRASRPCCAA